MYIFKAVSGVLATWLTYSLTCLHVAMAQTLPLKKSVTISNVKIVLATYLPKMQRTF